jgi:hypothetical protein
LRVSGVVIDRGQLIERVTAARKIDAPLVETAIAELTAAGLVLDGSQVGLTEAGRARHREIRATLDEVTARLFGDLPPGDLATAGRVLTIVTARASEETAAPACRRRGDLPSAEPGTFPD